MPCEPELASSDWMLDPARRRVEAGIMRDEAECLAESAGRSNRSGSARIFEVDRESTGRLARHFSMRLGVSVPDPSVCTGSPACRWFWRLPMKKCSERVPSVASSGAKVKEKPVDRCHAAQAFGPAAGGGGAASPESVRAVHRFGALPGSDPTVPGSRSRAGRDAGRVRTRFRTQSLSHGDGASGASFTHAV